MKASFAHQLSYYPDARANLQVRLTDSNALGVEATVTNPQDQQLDQLGPLVSPISVSALVAEVLTRIARDERLDITDELETPFMRREGCVRGVYTVDPTEYATETHFAMKAEYLARRFIQLLHEILSAFSKAACCQPITA